MTRAAAALGVLGLGQLYAVTFLAGVLTVFFGVAYRAYLPTLVGRDLTEGNSKRWPGRARASSRSRPAPSSPAWE